MNTKERLCRYINLKKENENRLERLARMRANAQLPPLQQGDGSQHTGGDGQRMTRAVENCLEYEEQIRPIIQANRKEMEYIETAISSLDDPLEREVLRLRYLDADNCRLIQWDKVANQLYNTDSDWAIRSCQRIHKQGIQKIKEVFGGK